MKVAIIMDVWSWARLMTDYGRDAGHEVFTVALISSQGSKEEGFALQGPKQLAQITEGVNGFKPDVVLLYDSLQEKKAGKGISTENIRNGLTVLREKIIPMDMQACWEHINLHDSEGKIIRNDPEGKRSFAAFLDGLRRAFGLA